MFPQIGVTTERSTNAAVQVLDQNLAKFIVAPKTQQLKITAA